MSLESLVHHAEGSLSLLNFTDVISILALGDIKCLGDWHRVLSVLRFALWVCLKFVMKPKFANSFLMKGALKGLSIIKVIFGWAHAHFEDVARWQVSLS